MRQLLVRLVAALSVLALLCVTTAAPRVAFAAPAKAAIAEVHEKIDEGRVQFEALQYDAAIKEWSIAYSKAPSSSKKGQQLRAEIAESIAVAQEEAFELDKDPMRLEQAKALLLREADAIEKSDPVASSRLKSRAESLEQKLEREVDEETEPTPDTTAATWEQALGQDPELTRKYKTGTGLMAAGLVFLGASIGCSMVSLVFSTGGSPDAGIIMLIPAGIFIGTGAPMAIAGGVIRKNAKTEAERRVKTSLLPVLGPRYTGLSFAGSF